MPGPVYKLSLNLIQVIKITYTGHTRSFIGIFQGCGLDLQICSQIGCVHFNEKKRVWSALIIQCDYLFICISYYNTRASSQQCLPVSRKGPIKCLFEKHKYLFLITFINSLNKKPHSKLAQTIRIFSVKDGDYEEKIGKMRNSSTKSLYSYV